MSNYRLNVLICAGLLVIAGASFWRGGETTVVTSIVSGLLGFMSRGSSRQDADEPRRKKGDDDA